jgi:CBS domain-containing protein
MMRAIDAARGPLIVAGPDASLQHTARLMDLHHVDAVVVTDDGAPVGIVTERDLVVRGLARGLSGGTPLRAVMTSDPVTVDALADVAEAYQLLREQALHRLPVVAGTKLVAILTLDDFAVEPPAELSRLVHSTAGAN